MAPAEELADDDTRRDQCRSSVRCVDSVLRCWDHFRTCSRLWMAGWRTPEDLIDTIDDLSYVVEDLVA